MINVFMKKNPTQTVPYEGKKRMRDKPNSEQLNVCIAKLTIETCTRQANFVHFKRKAMSIIYDRVLY